MTGSRGRSPVVRHAYDPFKRCLDVVMALLLMAAAAPVYGIVAILVAVRLGRPVIFRQERPGLNERPFVLLKFRSMLDVDESRGLVTNEQRMTTFGRRLRASSLDELPSLINVLRGDMSLVGPRPLRVAYLERYNARQSLRHNVRPGVTGLAQIRGRNALTWEDRLEFDVQYVEERSLALDLKILGSTIERVISRKGVEGDGLAAMSAFMGSEDDSGLREVDMDDRWLETRVSWLSDREISNGVSLSFVPDIDGMSSWLDRVGKDTTRRDWVYLDTSGQPVAMCGLAGVGTSEGTLYIYVNPTLHRRGFGRLSMRRLIRRAQSFGMKRLHLEVKRENAAAIQLYRSLGFNFEDKPGLTTGKSAMSMDLA